MEFNKTYEEKDPGTHVFLDNNMVLLRNDKKSTFVEHYAVSVILTSDLLDINVITPLYTFKNLC